MLLEVCVDTIEGAWSAVRGGATPMSMVLAGAAMSAFLGALTTALLLRDQQSFEQLRVWMTGSNWPFRTV